jgi:hypothetical protein
MEYFDPDGVRYGIPTFPWKLAPDGLATRRQLAELGRRPGGQPVVAQVMWRRRRGHGVAYLYEVAKALPKRQPTPAVLASLHKAMAARRHCPTCRQDRNYCIPTRWGMCLDCVEAAGLLPAPPTNNPAGAAVGEGIGS